MRHRVLRYSLLSTLGGLLSATLRPPLTRRRRRTTTTSMGLKEGACGGAGQGNDITPCHPLRLVIGILYRPQSLRGTQHSESAPFHLPPSLPPSLPASILSALPPLPCTPFNCFPLVLCVHEYAYESCILLHPSPSHHPRASPLLPYTISRPFTALSTLTTTINPKFLKTSALAPN